MVLSLLIKPLSAFLEMKVQDKIGHLAFGQYFAMFSFTFFFVTLNDMGANKYITKSIASSPFKQKGLFSYLFFFKLISIIAFPLIMICVAFVIYPEYLLEMFIIAIIFALIEVQTFFRATFQGHQLFSFDAIMANTEKTVLIFILSVLLLTTINLDLFLIARFTSVALACLIGVALLWKQKLIYTPKFNAKELKKLITKSFPFAFMAILYTLHERVDAVMLDKIIGNHEAGIYAAAYRWLDLFMMYLWTILPFFFAKFAHHGMDIKDKEKLLRAGVGMTSIPMIIIFGFGYFYSPVFFENIMKNSTSDEIMQMADTLKVLFFTLLTQGMFAVLSTFLTSNGHTKYINIIILISIVLNITLNFIYIPQYGTTAAAWTTFASTLFSCLANIIYILSKGLLRLPFLSWLKVFVLLALCLGAYYLTFNYLNWFITGFIVSLAILGLAYVFKLLDLKVIKHL